MATADLIAKALGGRKTGGGWAARCPAHNDRKPSLSMRDADGKGLVRCHAACDQDSKKYSTKSRTNATAMQGKTEPGNSDTQTNLR